MDDNMYKRIGPDWGLFSQVLWPPQNTQKGHPLWPIVSSKDSVRYGVVKEIVDILKTLEGKSQHHIQNTQCFVYEIEDITLGLGECITCILAFHPIQSPSGKLILY